MKKSIFKPIISVFLAVVLGLSLVFYDDIQSMFTVSVNKALKRNGLEGYGVSSSNPLAVKVGMEVLENGGNETALDVKNKKENLFISLLKKIKDLFIKKETNMQESK